MSTAKTTATIARYAAELRYELSVLNEAYAKDHKLKHCSSYGSQPVVCYEPDGNRHGNFLPETYRAILEKPQWARRLKKTHTSARTALPRNDRAFWSELDSSNSSDALLMNVFCYPKVFDDGRVWASLGIEAGSTPEFGFRARVPLKHGRFDRTEVDMRLGSLLVEAKLTEADFQAREKEIVENYRDFDELFDCRQLPMLLGRDSSTKRYASYQLIRSVLAAWSNQCAFCVLCDARRPDLVQAWYEVMSAVKIVDLRLRCKVLTWQELAQAVPTRLQEFLCEKYGIGANAAVTTGEWNE